MIAPTARRRHGRIPSDASPGHDIMRFLAALTATLMATLLATAPVGRAQAPAPDTPPKTVPTDRRIQGAVTPERVDADFQKDAEKRQASGKPAAFGRRYYFFFNMTAAEYAALAKQTVFLIVMLTHKSEELPLKRVYVRVDGRDTPVPRIAGSRGEIEDNSLATQVYGRYREDGIYLVPSATMLRDGQILMDFANGRTASLMMQLPSNVATEDAKKNPIYASPDAPAGAKPDLKELQAFIRRKLPGFPVPTALP
jgi:hypothetical protein